MAHKAADVTPDERHRDMYDRLYELYPATRDQVHALARLQAERGLVPADDDVDEAL